MAIPWVMIASLAAEAYDRNRKQADARRNAKASIQQSYASSLGAPGYGFQAEQAKRKIGDIEGENYLKQILPLLQNRRSRRDDDEDDL